MNTTILRGFLLGIGSMTFILIYYPFLPSAMEDINPILKIFINWAFISFCGFLIPFYTLHEEEIKLIIKSTNFSNIFSCYLVALTLFAFLSLLSCAIMAGNTPGLSFKEAIIKLSSLYLPMIISYTIGVWAFIFTNKFRK